MNASALGRAGRGAPPDDGFAILDAGPLPIAVADYARSIDAITRGELPVLAQDRNSTCYRVVLAAGDGREVVAIVKAPRLGPQRTNADTTFAGEAATLARLPALGFDRAPLMLARAAAMGSHFLFTTEVPGRHPDPRRHPLDATQFRALLAAAFALDRRSLMHHDLKAANVLVDGDRAAFIDFEFARLRDHRAAYAPSRMRECTDFNVLPNPHFPAMSNAANFEFRALHRYLSELATLQSAGVADALHRDYLAACADHHAQWALCLDELATSEAAAMAAAARKTPAEIRGRLAAAARHERMLQRLFAQPPAAIVRAERAVMAFRCHTFERRPEEARAAARDALAALRSAPSTLVPEAYAQSVRRTLDLVAHSEFPPA
jgi:predicted Ser/Thr protein kinase